MVEVKHPYLELFCRDDGTVRLPASGSHKERITKGTLRPDGYYVINFAGRTRRVHRLIAEAFIPNPENKPTVDHINHDTQLNAVSNLRWATRKEQTENTRWYTGLTNYQYSKKWKAEHPEAVKSQRKKYRETHKEELRIRNQEYRHAHPEKVREWRTRERAA